MRNQPMIRILTSMKKVQLNYIQVVEFVILSISKLCNTCKENIGGNGQQTLQQPMTESDGVNENCLKSRDANMASVCPQAAISDEAALKPVVAVVAEPHKEILREEYLQVKIADLGNSCWTV